MLTNWQKCVFNLSKTLDNDRRLLTISLFNIPLNSIPAERIDLWVGPEDRLPADKEAEISTMPFDFLGYILLSDNNGTHFKSRELKSVSPLDSNWTSYLKFSLHQNHCNHLNMYDQVSRIQMIVLFVTNIFILYYL